MNKCQDDRWPTLAVALDKNHNTRAIPNSGMALVLPTVDGNEGRLSGFAYQLAERSHQAKHVVYVTPVENAPVDDSPAALVITTYNVHQIAVKAVP